MTRKFKAGDMITFLTDPGCVDISANRVYTLYESPNGHLVFRDDVNDERTFAGCDGQVHDWMLSCEIEIFNKNEKPVMIDAEELLKLIDGGTRYNMNVEEVVAFLRGFIHAHKEENR